MLTYNVPTEVSKQKDLVVAKTDEIKGNKNEVVPLVFDHICTAVRFVTGSQMQPGTIKSVALKGVKYKGSYDLANDIWKLDNDVIDFTQSLDKEMSGSETDGMEVATGEATFMMLPQTLPTGAKVEVVFNDNMTGKDRLLEAPVAEMEWPQGKRLLTSCPFRRNITSPLSARTRWMRMLTFKRYTLQPMALGYYIPMWIG